MNLQIDLITGVIYNLSKQQVFICMLLLMLGVITLILFFAKKAKRKPNEDVPQRGTIFPNNAPLVEHNVITITQLANDTPETDSLEMGKVAVKKESGYEEEVQVNNQNITVEKIESEIVEKTIVLDSSKKDPIINTVAKKKLEIVNIPSPPLTKEKKRIGYQPYNYPQPEPICYPIVMMPKSGSVLAIPMEGRSGRKGYKEEDFKKHLTKYFSEEFQISDNRIIPIEGSAIPYSPDFTLGYWGRDMNIFIDIEIDEPYEGINDIETRKALHYKGVDDSRNQVLTNNGWIVIRLAEIQVHQNPVKCCAFIADIISKIRPIYSIPAPLIEVKKIDQVNKVQLWTKEEAEKMSKNKFREGYLKIDEFGKVAESNKIYIIQQSDVELSPQVNGSKPIAKKERKQPDPLKTGETAQQLRYNIDAFIQSRLQIIKDIEPKIDVYDALFIRGAENGGVNIVTLDIDNMDYKNETLKEQFRKMFVKKILTENYLLKHFNGAAYDLLYFSIDTISEVDHCHYFNYQTEEYKYVIYDFGGKNLVSKAGVGFDNFI